jgi:outer membrane protein assembly factor BamA
VLSVAMEEKDGLPGKSSSGQPEEGSFIQPLVTAESIARESKPYQLRFEADYAASSFVFTSGGAFQNYTEVVLSDMLSNHQIYVLFDLTTVYNISDIDVATQYIYQGERASYGGLLSSWKNLYSNENGYFWERNSGAEGLFSYPFTRTERVDVSPFWYARQREWYKYRSETGELRNVVQNSNLSGLSLGLTHDNTQWGYFHPTHGERMDLTIQQGVPFTSQYLSFTNIVPDIRKYFRLTERGSFAFRLAGGASIGKDPQNFYLGGGFTLRGYPYYTFYGDRDFLFNFETRFPIIDAIFFPIPGLAFGYFRSLLFADWGAAWNGDNTISWRGNKEDEKYTEFTPWTNDGGFHLVHSKMSFGTGIRWYMGIGDFRLDWAWRTNLQSVDAEPYVHVGLGSEF